MSPEKQTGLDWVAARPRRLSAFHTAIWAHAETASREYRSSADYVALLEPEAFAVPRSPSALDTVSLMSRPATQTKANIDSHTGSWVMREFVLVGGQPTADALAPRLGQIQYAWRPPTLGIKEELFGVLARNASHATAATTCGAYTRWMSKTRVGLPGRTMATATVRDLALAGPPVFSGEAGAFARAIQAAEGVDRVTDPFTERCRTLTEPEEEGTAVRGDLPPGQGTFTPDDYAGRAPAVRPYIGKDLIRKSSDGAHWGQKAVNGFPPAIGQTWKLAGATIGDYAGPHHGGGSGRDRQGRVPRGHRRRG